MKSIRGIYKGIHLIYMRIHEICEGNHVIYKGIHKGIHVIYKGVHEISKGNV